MNKLKIIPFFFLAVLLLLTFLQHAAVNKEQEKQERTDFKMKENI